MSSSRPRLSTNRFLLFLFLVVLTAIVLVTALGSSATAEPIGGGTLDPTTIPQFVTPLVIPPEMPSTGANYYEIAVRQFKQQILPAPFGATTVWSYGSVNHPGSFNYPAFTIEAKAGTPVRVKWMNQLVDEQGNYLPHLLPVDQTLHWANPPGGEANKDGHGTSQAPYTGPVPIVTHLHGAHVDPESDGYPEAWWLPAAKNIPAGYATRGTSWDQIAGVLDEPGAATFEYRNDQPAGTLWYHDHTLGMTRVNVYAGPAGFYLLRGGDYDLPAGVLPGPAPKVGDAAGTKYYEIPIVVQDRSFNADGSLYYPDNRAFFEGLFPDELDIPFIPEPAHEGQSDISPIWNPEFFGNTMVVNGNTWPYLQVEAKRYRLRLLNGCGSRFLILGADQPLTFWRVGSDLGFLPKPLAQNEILLGPAERADVVVDFSGFAPGTVITLINRGPDEPYGGGTPGVDFQPADPGTTGKVMQFRVVAATAPDTSTDPATLQLPQVPRITDADNVRQVTLNELDSETVLVDFDEDGRIGFNPGGEPFGPAEAQLGTLNANGTGNPLTWDEAVTENPIVGSTEIWEIYNFTMDAHPIHIHEVRFEVVSRSTMPGDDEEDMPMGPAMTRQPEPWEVGAPKDTVIAYPGEITRVIAHFDIAGRYVWHCHIIEHEDNEMMRPYDVVLPPGASNFSDVPADHRFYAAITALASARVVSGYPDGRFGPEDPLTRAQMAKIAVLGFGGHNIATTNLGKATFADVAYTNTPYPFDYVEEAAHAGYVMGYLNGNFGPFDTLTRMQMLRILVRAAGTHLAEPPAGYNPGFTDIDAADMATVAKAKFNNLIGGKTATTFEPNAPATRGHTVSVVDALMKLMQSHAGGGSDGDHGMPMD